VRDVGSKNGVSVNGRKIHESPIAPGDVIRLGDCVGVVASVLHVDGPWLHREIAPGVFGGALLSSVLAPVERASVSRLPVVLQGETGTGKEVVARAIHDWSGRPGPFVAINCAALPESLAEAELFGYRRGAFTGATQASEGHFKAADRGTLLLDEVLELPLPLQAKLLRALEENAIVPLGESRPQEIDVRVVCASQAPIAEAVAEGRFRGDLAARLGGLIVDLPALRERHGDVPYLFQELLRAQSGGPPPAVSTELLESLCCHDWPYNVRELNLLVQRMLALHGDETLLRRSHLPESLRRPASNRRKQGQVAPKPTVERLVDALRAHAGNVSRAAASLGMTRQRAYRMLEGNDALLDELRGSASGQRGKERSRK
jgi:transcriptional regulator with PAS, ATPase and Fis domain